MENTGVISEDDHARRVEARTALKHLRAHFLCKRCRKAIPETRRADARYCSQDCHDRYNWEQRNGLRTEIRTIMRSYSPKTCACGAELNNSPGRPGCVAKSCKRCRDNRNQRDCTKRKRLRKTCEA